MLARLILLALLLTGIAPLLARSLDDPQTPPLHLTQAVFIAEDRPQDEPAVVPLPDTWGGRGRSPDGLGLYRLHMAIERVPGRSWALRIDRLAELHERRRGGLLLVRLAPRPVEAGGVEAERPACGVVHVGRQ